jgi:hypothetical protein
MPCPRRPPQRRARPIAPYPRQRIASWIKLALQLAKDKLIMGDNSY